MRFPSRDQCGQPTLVVTNTFHFSDARSNSIIRCASVERVAMERPSGDHRGEYMPSDPGSLVTSRVFKLIRWIVFVSVVMPKTSIFPSGDQPGSFSMRSSAVSSCGGVPPSADTMYVFRGLPGSTAGISAENAILFPLGDQRGNLALNGGKLS